MEGRQVFAKTLIVVGTLIGLYLLFQLRGIIILLFGSILFASTIRPMVLSFEQRRIRRPFSILLAYLIFVLLLVGVLAVLLPALLARIQEFASAQPQIIQAVENMLQQLRIFAFFKANVWFSIPAATEMQPYLNQFQADTLARVRQYLLDGLRVISELVVLFVIAFYWLTERDRFEEFGLRLIPLRNRERFRTIVNDLEATLGAYVRGQAIASFTVGLFSFIGLLIIGVPYALLLAVIAAITELIPIVGPIIGGIPALLVGLITSPEKALLVILLYAAIQFVEAHILIPKIYEREVGLSSWLVILALAAGNILGGIVGAVLAIPVAAALRVLVRHLIVEPVVAADKPQVVGGAVLVGEAPVTVEIETPAPVTVAPKTASEVIVVPPGVEKTPQGNGG